MAEPTHLGAQRLRQLTMQKGAPSGKLLYRFSQKKQSNGDCSMARLVEASIATSAATTLLDISLYSAREQQQVARSGANPATLPTLQTARQLFDS
jgi:hypothetical protein